MFVLILKPQTSTRVIACVFFSTNHTWIRYTHFMCVLILKPTLESLHVCSFHKPHMDQPLESLHVFYFHKPHMYQPMVIALVFQSHCMCVLSTNHIWINH